MPISVLCLFLATPWASLRCVIMTFPGHTYLQHVLIGLGNYICITFQSAFLAIIIDESSNTFNEIFVLNVYLEVCFYFFVTELLSLYKEFREFCSQSTFPLQKSCGRHLLCLSNI